MKKRFKKLSHTIYECKYHVIFCPKYRQDHIHMVIEIPPKYAVSSVLGYLKGKLALKLFQRYEKLGKAYWGRHLWSRGYCVSTVGLNEEQIRKYVQWQEKKEREVEATQLKMF